MPAACVRMAAGHLPNVQVYRRHDACCRCTWQPQHRLLLAHTHLLPQRHITLPRQPSTGAWHFVSNQWRPCRKASGGMASPSPPLWSGMLLPLGALPLPQPPLQGRPVPVP